MRSILVPLDGSRLAEAILPAVAALAARFAARVTLLHVLERGAPARVHGEAHLTEPAGAAAYLDRVAVDLRAGGIVVDAHVHPSREGDVAASIVRHGEELRADLISLTTHGWGGARELLFGSVAQQVLGRGATPVLLVRPEAAPERFAPQRILVPLDGSPASEAALGPAREVAAAFGARLALLTVVPTLATVSLEANPAATVLPTAAAAGLDLEAESAGEYLERLAAEAGAEAEVRRGDPARVVVEAAPAYDLLVMATHGRSGLSAMWAGSVASRIIPHSPVPLLLVRSLGPVTRP